MINAMGNCTRLIELKIESGMRYFLLTPVLIVLICLVTLSAEAQVYFDDSSPDTIFLGNSSFYEIGINKSYGGILFIKNSATGENISLGSPFGVMLWGIGLNDGNSIWSNSPQNLFSYEWENNTKTLTMRYTQSLAESQKIPVTVTIQVSDESFFDMKMNAVNNSGNIINSIGFPYELLFQFEKDDKAALPYDYPGVMLESTFFSQKRSYNSSYPGVMHSDIVAFQKQNSNFAIYTLRDGLPVRHTWIGLTYNNDLNYPENTYNFHHDYPVWLKNGNSWSSPVTRVRISQSIIESAKSYRIDNNLGSFPSLKTKLKNKYESVIRSPYLYLAFGENTNLRFNEISGLMKKLPSPTIMFLTLYWGPIWIKNNPDLMPPDPNLGTAEEFSQMVDAMHKFDQLVMPFSFPGWWHEESPTLLNLPAPLKINDVASINENGEPWRFIWNPTAAGYWVSPYQSLVKNRLEQVMTELSQKIHSDLIYEDGFAAHAYDFNSSSPSPLDGEQGWLDHTRKYSPNLLIDERGYDRMAETSSGFLGTAFNFSVFDQNSNEVLVLNSDFGINNWKYYPIIPFLYNDKVIHYQYWWVFKENNQFLRWNLLYGCMLNHSPSGTDLSNVLKNSTPQFINLISDFQYHVASRTAGKLMTDYKIFTDKIKQSTFEDIKVLSNEDSLLAYNTGKHTLSPEGVLVTSSNGDLTAGIFRKFNNADLTSGDHYLIINNDTDSITIRQPMGTDTEMSIERPASWADTSMIKVHFIGQSNVLQAHKTVNSNAVRFKWQRIFSMDTAEYYTITYNNSAYASENVSICDGHDYNGWTKEGSYVRKLKTQKGNDSIVTTFIIVNPVFNITEYRTICVGQNYFGWTNPGTYNRTLQSRSGCDSLVTTVLTVNQVPNGEECKPVVLSSYIYQTNSDTLIVGNKDHYEIGINKSFGGLLYIKDKVAGKIVSTGSPFGSMLWGTTMKDGTNIWSTSSQNRMSYEWISNSSTLLLKYTPAPGDSKQFPVTVKLEIYDDPYFDMQMTVKNKMGIECQSVSFPLELQLLFDANDEAVLACDYPGIKLKSSFFAERRSISDSYPGSFHADYVSLKIKNSNIALYTLRDNLPVQMTYLGLTSTSSSPSDANTYSFRHEYPVWIKDTNSWTTPVTRVEFFKTPTESIKDYRVDNKLESFPSLKTKLGDKYDILINSPYYYQCFGETTSRKFNQMLKIVKKIPPPAIMMLSIYYGGGFHGFHPDYFPPDPDLGTMEDFKAMIRDFHSFGHLVMPFTLPIWWHENSPTIKNLASPLTISDIAQIDMQGNPRYTSWELGGKADWGYFVSPYHPFVNQRLDKLIKEMTVDIPSDLIYADVIGAYADSYDFNPASPDPVSFNEGWLDFLRKYSNTLIVNERGYDRMAETATGFMGTVRLHDYMVASGNLNEWHLNNRLGIDNWLPYPTAPFLYNDKTLTFNYWATGSNNKANLGWNLLFGCMLNMSDWEKKLETNSYPWVYVLSDFQKNVVSRIVGKLMTNYTEISNNITQSTFDDILVTRNSDPTNSYTTGEYTLPSEGVLVTSTNNDLTAGIFRRFNNEDLTSGDHYLIVNNDPDSITIRQPMGSDTELTIDRPSTWSDDTKIKVYSKGRVIYYTPKTITSGGICFNWQRILSNDTARYYVINYDKSIGIEDPPNSLSHGVNLYQNYPNPFSNETVIKYDLTESTTITLRIYNLLGLPIKTLVDQNQTGGPYEYVWDGTTDAGSKVPDGIYFIRLEAGGATFARKIIVDRY
jgi:hypothetical protein